MPHPLSYFLFKGHGMCLSCLGMMHIRVAHVAAAGFFSRYLSSALSYSRKLSVLLNKTCPSFIEILRNNLTYSNVVIFYRSN